jgi:hypothetical protein
MPGGGKGGGGVNIPDHYNITLGGGTMPLAVDAHIEPVTTTSNIAITQPIVTQSTSNSDSKASLDLKLEPVDLKVEPLDVKVEPLQVSTDSEIDLKPVVIDSCQTIKLAPLPPIHLRQPYSLHFGLTYMGMEVWGVNVSSHSETFLSSPPKHPGYEPHPDEHSGRAKSHQQAQPEPPKPGGLRVRVK